jgi:hypothetical protein
LSHAIPPGITPVDAPLGAGSEPDVALQIAGRSIEMPRSLAAFAGLEGFAEPTGSRPSEPFEPLAAPDPEHRTMRGSLAGIEREIDVAWRPDGAALSCGAEHATLRLGAAPRVAAGSTANLSLELAAGPCLLLALAATGRYVLHASAARLGDRVLLFGGESGHGKSTLARAFGARALADDLVAVDPATGTAWTRFLQRKWSAQTQAGLPASLSHLTWISLARTSSAATVEPLSRSAALKDWLAHTAAARLYPEAWTRAWLEACGGAAERLAAFRLAIPWRPGKPDLAAREAVRALEQRFG